MVANAPKKKKAYQKSCQLLYNEGKAMLLVIMLKSKLCTKYRVQIINHPLYKGAAAVTVKAIACGLKMLSSSRYVNPGLIFT